MLFQQAEYRPGGVADVLLIVPDEGPALDDEFLEVLASEGLFLVDAGG